METSLTMKRNVISLTPMRDLITALQKERSMTCLMLSTDQKERKDMLFLLKNELKSETDQRLDSVTRWESKPEDGPEMITKESFRSALDKHRNRTEHDMTNCNIEIEWFSNAISLLMLQRQRIYRETEAGDYWELAFSKISLISAIDRVSVKAALGGVYFAQGKLDPATYRHFEQVIGQAHAHLKTSKITHPSTSNAVKNLSAMNEHLIETLELIQDQIHDSQMTNNSYCLGDNKCTSEKTAVTKEGLGWLDNMTTYQNLLEKVEKSAEKDLIDKLESKLAFSTRIFRIALAIVCCAGLICPPSIFWYMYEAACLQEKVYKFTKGLARTAGELQLEQQKTDFILYQMLPSSIVNDLKLNRAVQPEHYEMVSIMFSDIKGFTVLSSKSSPIEITQLLNILYTNLDLIVEKYDVYKVETIGDAYMIASGLPKRNGDRHSDAICTTALEFLLQIEDMMIPHMTGEKLLMRIGIHCGPCVAGIVGTKMPRYCLFGDTVNVASRMESTGMAMCIHLSSEARWHLEINHPAFRLEARPIMNVKGKGEMSTFWLLGKDGFPYHVDLDKVEMYVNSFTYWRIPGDVDSETD